MIPEDICKVINPASTVLVGRLRNFLSITARYIFVRNIIPTSANISVAQPVGK